MSLSKWVRRLGKRPTRDEPSKPDIEIRSSSRHSEDDEFAFSQIDFEGKEDPKKDISASSEPGDLAFQRLMCNREKACKRCKTINPKKKDIIFHYNYDELVKVAGWGCRVCDFFAQNCPRVDDMRAAEIYVNPIEGEVYYRQPTSSGGSRKAFQIFSSSSREILQLSITCHVSGGPHIGTNYSTGTTQGTVAPLRQIHPDPLAKSSLTILRSWLTTCLDAHPGCAQAVGSVPPTRLISISSRGALKLCKLDASSASHVKYAALSHCWGERQVFHTTSTNLLAYMLGFSIGELPGAFQDAVTVTQKLGLKYLWIDSICIVQDSDDDWANECLRMGDYYRNAFVTISALEAPDSHTSFLQPRKIPAAVQLPGFSEFSVRPKRIERRQIFRSAVLNSRGWSFQERLLSTRVLHFTQHEMFWECRTCSAEETSTAHYQQNAVDFRSLGPSDGEDFKRALSSLDPDHFSESNGAFLLWQRLVRQFSRRSLTYISDRLPAVSGLAALIEANTGSRYLAGIWEHDLSGLAWFRDSKTYIIDHSKSRSRIGEFLAPSWSWAGMRASVTYRFDDGEIIRSDKDPIFVQSNLDISTLNPFGNVAGGYITISTLAIPVRISSSYVYAAVGDRKVGLAYMDRFDPSFDSESEDKILAVRVCERGSRRTNRSEFLQDNTVVHFLLVKSDNNENDMWHRIGVGVSRDNDYTISETFSHPFTNDDRTLLRLI